MKKVLNLLLSVSLAFSSLVIPNMVKAEDSETATVSIYPKPQSVSIDNEGMKLNGSVDILVHGEQDVATLPKLKAILDAESMTYQEVTTLNNEHATIILANDCDNCDICNSVSDAAGALNEAQGYVLKADNENTNGKITIVGSDADGVYYGVMTLKQMFEQKTSDGRIAKVVVSDYPDVKFRGYVEGFYGIPWTHEDRAELFEDTTNYKMTTYIYAPKDDPYHRGSWRTLYPEKEAGELTELAQKAAENNMEFCWTIHPGADYNYTSDSDGDGMTNDFETLIAKFEQVYSFGVRQFGIFYDDLDYGVANGTRHAQVINDAYNYMRNKYNDVKPMITVVTRYTNAWGADWYSYFRPFMQNIHEDTLVLWTGQSTMSAITKNYMEYPKTMTGITRDFGVWWNYPVNDYSNSNMFMAPLDCLGTEVDNISTFFLNPMSEADASRVAIYSGADYAWNISEFDSYNSWLRAIEELVPEAKDEFARFADNLAYLDQGNGFIFDESVYLIEDIERFNNASGDALLNEVRNMKAKFEQMVSDAEKLANINNEKLYDEIQYHLGAYKLIAEAGVAAMGAYEGALTGNVGKALSLMPMINAKLDESMTYKIPILNGEAQVELCSKRIKPFIRAQATKISEVLSGVITVNTDAKFITNNTDFIGEVKVENNAYVFKNVEGSFKVNDYVGIKLPEVMNILNVKAMVQPTENFKLQYSLNGLVWYDMPSTNNENELKSDMIVTTAYLRLVCTQACDASVDRFSVGQFKQLSSGESSAEMSASTDLGTYESYAIGNAVDGNLNTWYWSDSGTTDGNYIKVDLKGNKTLDQVVIYSGINKHGVVDAFASTQLEVSDDGNTWNAVGSAISINNYAEVDSNMKKLVIDAQGRSASYFRLKAVGESESWAKVYEITYSEADVEIEGGKQATSTLVPSEGSIDNMIDENKNTSVTLGNNIKENDYVQVDLGMIVPLYDASIYFGKEGTIAQGFTSTKLQTSANGIDWKDVETVTSANYVDNNGLAKASFASDGKLVRFVRFVATEASSANVKVYEVEYNQTLASTTNPSVSTNMNTYQTNSISYAMDNNMNTKFYSSAGANIGDYIQVDLGSEIAIFDASIIFGGDPNVAGSVDGFATMQLQVSNNGSSWTNVGEPMSKDEYQFNIDKYTATFKTDGVGARYIRFSATQASDSWVQAYEINFNTVMDNNTVRYADEASDGIKEFYPIEDYINVSTLNIAHSDKLDDGDIYSGPTLTDVKANDALIYPMNVITNVSSISLLQSGSVISNADIALLNTDGTWENAGKFDDAFKEVMVNKTILAVKLTFDGSVQPDIYEIMVSELTTEFEPADYTAVDNALASVPTDLSIYTDESVEVLQDALDSVVRNLDKSYQERVDAMAQDIIDAVANLKEKPSAVIVDKSLLSALIAQVEAMNAEEYTAESWASVATTLQQAKVVEANAQATQQEVDDAKEALETAVANLERNEEPQPIIPEKVVNVVAQDTNYKTITLTWDASEGATAYDVYRKSYKEDATFELEATVNEPTYASTGVMTGKEYTFYVVAKNEAGEAEASDVVAMKTTLQGKVRLAIEQVSASKFFLSWNRIDGATRYIIYRKRNDDKMKKVLTLGKDDVSYTTAEMPHGDYEFVVKAGRYDSVDRVMTAQSNKVEGSVDVPKPELTLTAGSKQIKASWDKLEGVTHYQVYRATSKSGQYTKLKTTTATSFTSKSLTSGKKYYFKVRGYKTYKSGEDIKYTVYTNYSSIMSATAK